MTTLRLIERDHIKEAVCFVLDFIDTFPARAVHFRRGKGGANTPSLSSFHELASSEENSESRGFIVSRKESEAERFIRTASQYSCMQIDLEYLRGRYFNMKSSREGEEKEMLNRNQYIRQVMSSFETEYEAGRGRKAINNYVSKVRETSRSRGEKRPESQRFRKEGRERVKAASAHIYAETVDDKFYESEMKGALDKMIKTVGAKAKSASFRVAYE
jgi:cell division septum initiation protein DivIVA